MEIKPYAGEPADSIVSEPDISLSYTYEDYLAWTTEERFELIKGRVFRMGAAPSVSHHNISVHLGIRLYNFLNGKSCQVFFAPFDVRLARTSLKNKEVTTVVQPDLCVVCDPAKIDEKGCMGAPDIVVEVISPGNSKKKLRNKFEVYQESGVQEYWIIFPGERIVTVHTLSNEKIYTTPEYFTEEDILTTPVLPGFEVSIREIFK